MKTGVANAGAAFVRNKENTIVEVGIKRMGGFMRKPEEFVKVILDFFGSILLRVLRRRYFFPEVFRSTMFRFFGIFEHFRVL